MRECRILMAHDCSVRSEIIILNIRITLQYLRMQLIIINVIRCDIYNVIYDVIFIGF